MPFMKFGIHLAGYTYPGEPATLFDRVCDVAVAAEEAGFDAVFVPDHVQQNNMGGGPTGPMFEAYSLLTALGARTRRVRLGALVSAVTMRNPAFLAKSVTTLDVVSGGRAVLGVGAAWDGAESGAYGIDFPPLGKRMDILEQTLQICRAMFAGQPATVTGADRSIENAYNSPQPIDDIPILVGGGGEVRTLRLVAQYGDACNVLALDPSAVTGGRHKLDVLERHCEAVGRDPKEITRTVSLVRPPDGGAELVDTAGAFFEAGFDAVIAFSANRDAETVQSWGRALVEAF